MPTPRKPVAHLKATGNHRPEREPGRADVSYPLANGEAPAYLKGLARSEYGRLAMLMIERGTLSEADVQTLAIYASLTGQIQEATQKGKPVPASTLQTWLSIGRDLGLTPASRTKVSPMPEPAKPEADEWARFRQHPATPKGGAA